jgi:uncharacterized protein (DUF58 family)
MQNSDGDRRKGADVGGGALRTWGQGPGTWVRKTMNSRSDPSPMPQAPRLSLTSRLRKRISAWARRRHGIDNDPFVIPSRRVYILPTRLGLIFSGMLVLMFLGAMNYANNLALALTFLLGSIAMVAMHHCQRNLAGLQLGVAASEPVFAGQMARLRLALGNAARVMRYEMSVHSGYVFNTTDIAPAAVAPNERVVVDVAVPTTQRGRLLVDHVMVSTQYPFGLFRAWTHVHLPLSCIVYPKPSERTDPPFSVSTDTGGAQDSRQGDDDFAGLRSFHPGDSPRRIAWKAFARGQELQVKQYSGTAVTSHIFDFASLEGMDTEARLSMLTRWIEDAHSAQRAYGLRLPNLDIEANVGAAHRQRCLTALALFGLDAPHAVPHAH